MSKGQVNLQDMFLNQVRKEHIPVTIYLIGGVQLKGLIKGFDSFTVMLDSPAKPTQIVYKHAIASVVPSKQISLMAEEAPKEERTEEKEAEEKETEEKDAGA